MDSSQPFFTAHNESMDGFGSGGSWNLSLLDDNLLHELAAFSHADDSESCQLARELAVTPNSRCSAEFNRMSLFATFH